jgi:hypothetical protein
MFPDTFLPFSLLALQRFIGRVLVLLSFSSYQGNLVYKGYISSHSREILMKKIVSLLMILGFASISMAQEPVKEGLDYGDYTSVTLQVNAWGALGEGEYADAVKYTEKCSELYEDEARKMQASLTEKAPKDHVHDYWALNDVGTCYFIRGEALSKLNKNTEAVAAYKVVMDDLYYAQAWDPKGWFWAPADAAKMKIEMLKFKNDSDF